MYRQGKKLTCRDRRHDWDDPVYIEDGYLDDKSSSSKDIAKAGSYVPASSGSPVKVFSRSEKRAALDVANPVLSNLSGKTLIYRKVKDGKKDEPYYKELKEQKNSKGIVPNNHS